MPTLARRIAAELRRPPDDARPIEDSTVRRWMRATDPRARRNTYDFLLEPRCVARVTPPLGFDECFDWLLKHWAWCFRSDYRGPRGDADARWYAADEMMRLLVSEWDAGRDRSYFEQAKAVLAEVYRTGAPDLRNILETALLEHLFERRGIRTLFRSWKDDPQLRVAYDSASAWVLGGGRAMPPAPRRRRRRRET